MEIHARWKAGLTCLLALIGFAACAGSGVEEASVGTVTQPSFTDTSIAPQMLAGSTSSGAGGYQMAFGADGLSESVDAASGNLRVNVDVASLPGLDISASYSTASDFNSWNPTISNSAGLGAYWSSNWFGRFRWDLRQPSWTDQIPDETTALGDPYSGGPAGLELSGGGLIQAYRPVNEDAEMRDNLPPFDDLSDPSWQDGDTSNSFPLPSGFSILDREWGRLTDGSYWRVLSSTTYAVPHGCFLAGLDGHCYNELGQVVAQAPLRSEMAIPDEIEVVRPNGTRMYFRHRVGRPRAEGHDNWTDYPDEFSPRVVGDHPYSVEFTSLYLTSIRSPDGKGVRFSYFGDGAGCKEFERTPIPRVAETGYFTSSGSFVPETRAIFHADGFDGTVDSCSLDGQSRITRVAYPGPGSHPLTEGADWRETRFEWCGEVHTDHCATSRGEEGPDLVAVHTERTSYGFEYEEAAFERPQYGSKMWHVPIPVGMIVGALSAGTVASPIGNVNVGHESAWIDVNEFRLPRLSGIALPGGDRVEYEWQSHVSLIEGRWRRDDFILNADVSAAPGFSGNIALASSTAVEGELDPGHAVFYDGVASRTYIPLHLGTPDRWDLHHTFLQMDGRAYSASVVVNPLRAGASERSSSLFLHAPIVERNYDGSDNPFLPSTSGHNNPFRPSASRAGALEESYVFSNNIWCTGDTDLVLPSGETHSETFGGICFDAMTDPSTLLSRTQMGYSSHMVGLGAKADAYKRWVPNSECISPGPMSSGIETCEARQYQPVWLTRSSITATTEYVDDSTSSSPSCCYEVERENLSTGVNTTHYCQTSSGLEESAGCCTGATSTSPSQCAPGQQCDLIDNALFCTSVGTCGGSGVCGGNPQLSTASACAALPSCSGDGVAGRGITTVVEQRVDNPAGFSLVEASPGRSELDYDGHAPFVHTWVTSAQVDVVNQRDEHSFPLCTYSEHAVTRRWLCSHTDARNYRQDTLTPGSRDAAQVMRETFSRTSYVTEEASSPYRNAHITSLVRSTSSHLGGDDSGPLLGLTVYGYDQESSVLVDNLAGSTGGMTRSAAYPVTPVQPPLAGHTSQGTGSLYGYPTARFTVDPFDTSRVHSSFALFANGNDAPAGALLESATETRPGYFLRNRYGYHLGFPGHTAYYEVDEGGHYRLLSTRNIDPMGFVHSVRDRENITTTICYDPVTKLPAANYEGTEACSSTTMNAARVQTHYTQASGTTPTRVEQILRDADGNEVRTYSFFDGLGRPIGVQNELLDEGGKRVWGQYNEYIGTGGVVRSATLDAPIDASDPSILSIPNFATRARTEATRDARGRVVESRLYDPTGSLYRTTNSQTTFNFAGGNSFVRESRTTSDIPGVGVVENVTVADGLGRVQSTQSHGAPALTYAYDMFDRLTQVNHPDGEVTTYTYGGPFGRRDSSTHPEHGTQITTSGLTRLLSATSSDGRIVTPSYDSWGRVTSRTIDGVTVAATVFDTVPVDSLLTTTADPHLDGRIARVVGQDETRVDYAYDDHGQLVEQAYEYPEIGIKRTFFDNDADGRVRAMRYQPGEPDAISFRYHFSARGTIASIDTGDDTCDISVCGDIDGDGSIGQADIDFGSDPGNLDHCARLRMDVAQRVDASTFALGRDGTADEFDLSAIDDVVNGSGSASSLECGPVEIARFASDAEHYRAQNTLLGDSPAPQLLDVQADWLGRTLSVNDPSAWSGTEVPAFGYRLYYESDHPAARSGAGFARGDGLITAVDWAGFRPCAPGETGAGCDSAATGSYVYGYDDRGALTTALREDDTSPGRLEATYNTIGQLQTLTRDGATQSYTYSGRQLAQVTGALDAAFAYDSLGRVETDTRAGTVLSTAYTNVGLPRVVDESRNGEVNRRRYDYDAAGQRYRTRTFHIQQGLIGIDTSGFDASMFREGETIQQRDVLDLDCRGRNCVLNDGGLDPWNPSGPQGPTTTTTVTTSDRIETTFADYVDGELHSWSLPGVGYRIPLGSPMGLPGDYAVLTDHLGSPRVTVNGYGEVVGASDYDPYGQVLQSETTLDAPNLDSYAELQSMGFYGANADEDFGAPYQHAQARVYDPSVGRFLQPDPLAQNDPTRDGYNYAFNNPANLTDPSGLWPISFAGGSGCTESGCMTGAVAAAGQTLGGTVTDPPGWFDLNGTRYYILHHSSSGGFPLTSTAVPYSEDELFGMYYATKRKAGDENYNRRALRGDFGEEVRERYTAYWDRQWHREHDAIFIGPIAAAGIAVTAFAAVPTSAAVSPTAIGTFVVNEARDAGTETVVGAVGGPTAVTAYQIGSSVTSLSGASKAIFRRFRRSGSGTPSLYYTNGTIHEYTNPYGEGKIFAASGVSTIPDTHFVAYRNAYRNKQLGINRQTIILEGHGSVLGTVHPLYQGARNTHLSHYGAIAEQNLHFLNAGLNASVVDITKVGHRGVAELLRNPNYDVVIGTCYGSNYLRYNLRLKYSLFSQ